jgi:hypothetical protein
MIATMSDDDKHERSTRHFTPDAGVGWQYAVASLERLNTWAVRALRMGTLWLLQRVVVEMARPGAKPELLARAKELLAALERLPWD